MKSVNLAEIIFSIRIFTPPFCKLGIHTQESCLENGLHVYGTVKPWVQSIFAIFVIPVTVKGVEHLAVELMLISQKGGWFIFNSK